MIRLYISGDGELDAAMLPQLICAILRTSGVDDPQFEPILPEIPWTKTRLGLVRLQQGSGLARRLEFAAINARSSIADGLAVTLDGDKAQRRTRLQDVMKGRDAIRNRAGQSHIPIALGEARPHGEAWLLADQQAVKDALEFPPDEQLAVANEIVKDPKAVLQGLLRGRFSGRFDTMLAAYEEVARNVALDRCQRAKETGLEEFAEEVRRELGPLFSAKN